MQTKEHVSLQLLPQVPFRSFLAHRVDVRESFGWSCHVSGNQPEHINCGKTGRGRKHYYT